MILRKIYFPPALGASGVQGFFGDPDYPEYKHSRLIKLCWGDIFKDIGFVAKTATVNFNKGNVKLTPGGFAFKKFLPNAIYPMPFKNAALNAVGLSNPGFENLLSYGIWQHKPKPFMLSFMAIGKTRAERIAETKKFMEIMKPRLFNFMADFALQVNLSCPNTGHDQSELVAESTEMFDILGVLGIPLIPKINALLPPEMAHKILLHEHCDALCFSNTIPFGEFPNDINWKKYSLRNGKSPLEVRGYAKGGLSGKPIFRIVYRWLEMFTKIDSHTKPIIAGGGVTTKNDVRLLARFPSVEAISIGTIAFTKPWVVKGIIKECYECLLED